MTLEDIIIKHAENDALVGWEKDMMASISAKLISKPNSALTTRQVETVVKIFNRHTECFDFDYAELSLIKNPTYRFTPIASQTIINEVRAIGESNLVFRFKFNIDIITTFKKMMNKASLVKYNKTHRLWIASVVPANVDEISDIIGLYGFNFDDDVLEILSLATQTKKASCSLENNELSVKNNNTFLKILLSRNI